MVTHSNVDSSYNNSVGTVGLALVVHVSVECFINESVVSCENGAAHVYEHDTPCTADRSKLGTIPQLA